MREIKFRLWIPHSEDWKRDLELNNKPLTHGEMLFSEYKELKRDAGFIVSDDWIQKLAFKDHPKGIWMQYTGLKDKNGKEIFEGDVIKYWDSGYNTGGIGDGYVHKEVKFFNSSWNVYETMTVEIVGNIYENPELLGDTSERD